MICCVWEKIFERFVILLEMMGYNHFLISHRLIFLVMVQENCLLQTNTCHHELQEFSETMVFSLFPIRHIFSMILAVKI